MKQTTLTQSGAPGRVRPISHTSTRSWILSKFSTLYWICLLLFLILVGVELPFVYSDHSILECYNLFSGVELSMRSFFVISLNN